MNNPLLITSACLVTMLAATTGCMPKCVVATPNAASAKADWFGPGINLKGAGSWTRAENYTGKSVYFENIDLDVLKDCKPCDTIRVTLRKQFDESIDSYLTTKLKSLKVTKNRNSADLIAHIKIASFKERSKTTKVLGHIAPLGATEDTYKILVKLVDKVSNKVIFGYCSINLYTPSGSSDGCVSSLAAAIDNFNHKSTDGIWFTDCP
jgi:hypothetical protein